MNAIRPSAPRVPTAMPAGFYVYSADNNHVGPVTADVVAHGVLAGKVPENAFVSHDASQAWTPITHVPEIAEAIRIARSTPSSMRPASMGMMAAATVVTPPPPALPTHVGPISTSAPTVMQSPSSPPTPLQTMLGLSPGAPPVSVAPSAPPASLPPTQSAPPVALAPAAQVQAQAPAPLPPTVASPVAPAVAAAAKPAAAAAAPAAAAKPPLDPRFKFLPLGIFGAFAFVGVLETIIVLATR